MSVLPVAMAFPHGGGRGEKDGILVKGKHSCASGNGGSESADGRHSAAAGALRADLQQLCDGHPGQNAIRELFPFTRTPAPTCSLSPVCAPRGAPDWIRVGWGQMGLWALSFTCLS